MKKFFFFFILIITLTIYSRAHAAPPYPLQVDATETTMTVTLSGATGVTTPLLLMAQTAPFSGSVIDYATNNGIIDFTDQYAFIPSPGDRIRTPDTNGIATWKFTSYSNTTYYVRVYDVSAPNNPILVTETKTLTTPAVTTFYGKWPLDIAVTGQTATFSGKVDTTKYATVGDIKIELQYSTKPFTDASPTLPAVDAYSQISHLTKDGQLEGVNDAGTYFFTLTGLTPGQLYFFRQIVKIQGTLIDIQGDSLTAGEAYTPSGSSAALDAENKHVYNLLAPWPGLSKLYDPGLCAQKKLAGTLSPDAICDINGFISFAFRIIIGFTAVMLVLRLVYEGYQYMMTDVPFLRASAKSNFGSALIGLIIALSAYVILNTINPKLVNNTIAIDQVSVGIDLVGDGDGEITLATNTAGLPTGVYCPGNGGLSAIPQIAKSFVGKVSYSMTERGKMRPDGDINLDCSSYVSQVLKCAGYSIPGVADKYVSTSTINTKGEQVTSAQISNNQLILNGKAVKAGDVFGWITPNAHRHVVMSLGGTRIIDVHGGTGNKDNAKEMSIDFYMNVRNYKIQYVYRLPI